MPSLALAANTPTVISADEIRNEANIAHAGFVDTVILEVPAGATIAVTARLKGSPLDDDAGLPIAYENMATGEVVAGGTPISAAALYRVPCDNCDVILTATGAVSVVYSAVHGG